MLKKISSLLGSKEYYQITQRQKRGAMAKYVINGVIYYNTEEFEHFQKRSGRPPKLNRKQFKSKLSTMYEIVYCFTTESGEIESDEFGEIYHIDRIVAKNKEQALEQFYQNNAFIKMPEILEVIKL